MANFLGFTTIPLTRQIFWVVSSKNLVRGTPSPGFYVIYRGFRAKTTHVHEPTIYNVGNIRAIYISSNLQTSLIRLAQFILPHIVLEYFCATV